MKTKSKNAKIKIVTLGCSKNTVDSERLATQLRGNGFTNVHHEESTTPASEVVIINTCGFIDLAKEESINTILAYAQEKNIGNINQLYVTGCLSERYKNDLEAEIPEVDGYFGTMDMPALLGRFNADYKKELIGERLSSTPLHYAYLKISEGCNRTCSFCAIPLMRGGHRSRKIEDLVDEAKFLASRGVKELILIAQELTYYGLDLYKKRALGTLLDHLESVDGIEWIRLHYMYPSKFPRDVFDVIRRSKKVCNYIDMPLQHSHNDVLKRMKRQTTVEELTDLLNYARSTVPNLAIRTTFMVGFPGETDDEFNQMLQFIKDQKFNRLGVFKYSHEEDTSAYSLEDNVPDEIKTHRYNQIMEVQQEISYDLNQLKIGSEEKVIIDRREGSYFIGRSQYDSPEVDNEVLIPLDIKKPLMVGGFYSVKITSADDYDLHGILSDIQA